MMEPSTSKIHHDSSSEYTSADSDSNDEKAEQEGELRNDLTENYQDELENDLRKEVTAHKVVKRDKKVKVVRKPQSKMPVHLKGLMGEANLRFARGDIETAEKMCYEVIRQESHAYEPYVTLSQLYESTDLEKSMQYLTIAAHLNPSNADLWLRLSQLYIDKNNMKAAVTCSTRAIQAEPKNYGFHLRRIKLLEQLNDTKFALKCKVRLLQIYSRKNHEEITSLAKELAEIYHREKEYQRAAEIFSVPFKKCSKHITPEMVNIYLELLLLNENYLECLEIFVQYCNIEIELVIGEGSKIKVESFRMPDELPIDLRIKFTVCLIKLEAYDLVEKIVAVFLGDESNAETIGDLYLDVAEAFMSMDQHFRALEMLIPLIKSVNFSLAAVWLKYAECLNKCQMYEQAVESYFKVMRLAPQHIEVRHPLSVLLIKLDRETEALEVLKQDPDCLEIDVTLLMKRIELLRKLNMTREYFKAVELWLSRHCIICLHHSELRGVTFQETIREKHQRINKMREFRGEPPVKQELISINEPSPWVEYELYKEILSYCYKNRFFKELKMFAFCGMSSSRFKNSINEITIMTLFACILMKDSYHSYPIIRDLIIRKHARSNLLWNLFNLTMQTQDEFRHSRFLMKQNKIFNYDFVKILEANNAIACGSYKIATIYLLPYLKFQPTPFIYLLLGVIFLQVSCQKHKGIKKKLTLCSVGLFHNYANKRGKLAYQEVCYNLGRLYHQYGIQHIAGYYYNLVLNSTDPFIAEHSEILDLKKEAAFNLFLIYRDCDNLIGARNLLKKYLTV